jgi:hypothetical protein
MITTNGGKNRMFGEKRKPMYHEDFVGVSHAHVAKIPEDHPHKDVFEGGVTRRFKQKRGLY